MEAGRIEAILTARFDKDPFVKFDKALDKSERAARKGVKAKLDTKADTRGTDKMQRELKDTERQADRTARSMHSGFGSMGKSALKGAVGVGALFAAYRVAKTAVTDTVDLAKASMGLARITGMEINQASQLISVMKVRGVETTKLNMSFTVLSKQMEAANKGTKNASAAFKELGVSQATLKTGDTVQAFKEAADGLAKLENGSKKTALASQLFGRGYQALFPILDMGSAGIQEQLDLAHKMGAELGTNNPNEIKKGIEAQRKMKLAMVGLNLVLGKELIPILTDAATKVADFAQGWRDSKGPGGEAKKVFQEIWGVLDKLTQPLRDHPRLIGLLAGAYVAFKLTVGGLKLLSLFMNTIGTPTQYGEAGTARGKAFGVAFQVAAVVGLGYLIYEQFQAGVDLVKGKVKNLNIFPSMGPIIGKWVSSLLDPVGGAAGNFGERIKKGWLGRGFTNAFNWIGDAAKNKWNDLKDIFSGKGSAGMMGFIHAPSLRGFDGVGREIGRWIREAIANIGRYAATAYARGRELASRTISGVGDLLSGLGGRVSRWVRTAVNNVGEFASEASRKGQSVGRNILNGVAGFVNDLPGKVSGYVRRAIDGVGGLAGRAASAGASVGRAVINGIGDGLKNMGSFLSNVGQGIRNWINANTAFGDSIKVGPVTVHLPALAKGGKVGPTLKGAQFFMAGEGGKDEWVISQEGNRSKNIGWAVDALEKLTGKKVAMHAGGALIGKALGPALKKSVGKLGNYSTYPKTQSDKIDQLETKYGQQSRIYDISNEEFLTSHTDGSVTVNTSQIDDRLRELDKLHSLRTDLMNAVKQLNSWITTTAKTLGLAMAKLKKALGKAKKKDRKVYSNEIKKMGEARSEMLGLQPDLLSSAEDSRIDLLELDAERADVASMKLKGEAATPPEPPTPGDPGTPDTPAAAPPSPEEIAQAAAAQFASFTANRASLFGSFGQNFVGAGGQLTAASAAAGFRMFGGGQADGGGVFGSAGGSGFADMTGGGFGSAQRAGAGGVMITNNYAAPPPDPHTWSQGLAWEIRTAV